MIEDRDQILHETNTILTSLEESQIREFKKPQFPVVFIIGTPRSGHTLLSQLLAASGGLAYISNFVARFWMAPYIGAKIELALGIRERQVEKEYFSEYGKTTGWAGPHEFGNFLRRWLPFGETHRVDLEGLPQETAEKFAQEVAALEAIYGKPVFFRNIIYGLNVDLLLRVFPDAIFVVCRRDILHQAESILIARQRLTGDKRNWWSLRPKEYPKLIVLPYWEQGVAQIYYTHKAIKKSLSRIGRRQWLEIHYSDLCKAPREQVPRIFKAVERMGGRADWRPNAIPNQFESTDVQRISNEDFQKIREAAKRYFDLDDVE